MKRQTISVRAWTEQPQPPKRPEPEGKKKRDTPSSSYRRRNALNVRVSPGLVLVFDTETTIDVYQNLMIGSYLIAWINVRDEGGTVKIDAIPLEEGLFYADDLPDTDPKGFEILKAYAERGKVTSSNWQDALTPKDEYSSFVNWTQATLAQDFLGMPYRPTFDGLQFMPASVFVNDKLYEYGNKIMHAAGEHKSATIVTANGPFDFSRLAHAVHKTRPQFDRNGYSLRLLPGDDYEDKSLTEEIKHQGNIQIARRGALGNRTAFADKKQHERDYFVDVLNLGFALTNSRYSLDAAARAFVPPELGKSFLKKHAVAYGEITEDFIAYMRHDVLATYGTYVGQLMEVWQHPLNFDETRAYSPATLGKAYVKAMGTVPILTRQPDFSRPVLGYAMSTLYGGRAECRVRKVPVPIWYFDFTSMYMTVNSLMKLWNCWIQERVEHKDGTKRVRALLAQPDLYKRLFDQETWPQLRGIVQIKPHDDILPVRTRLGGASNTIAIAKVTSDMPLWYSLPDVVASTILTGKAPEIIQAIDFAPAGNRVQGLTPVKLRNVIDIDPNRQDFFKVVTEQRQAIKLATTCGKCGTCSACRTSESSKVTGNACAYGMNAEFNQETIEKSDVHLYGIDDSGKPIIVEAERLDKPGEFSFPPIATMITGGARLMLAMLEKAITDAGGIWVAADTDSMMPVVTPDGKPVETPHGAIPAISEAVATEIQDRFDSLNPYDPEVAPGIHILKREHDKDPRPLYCYAISAKRYALFHLGPNGVDLESGTDLDSEDIETLSGDGRKEHGLGTYMSPYNPDEESQRGKRQWITEIWHYLICRELGIEIDEPSFFDIPAMIKVSLTTWTGYEMFKGFNDGKSWAEQIKPYNFAMSPVVLGIDNSVSNNHKRLITPYERDARKWSDLDYIDVNSPDRQTHKIRTLGNEWSPIRVPVRRWREIVNEFGSHPEVKFCDANGRTCAKETRGLLYRHSIYVGRVDYIGKEANRFTSTEEITGMAGDTAVNSYGSGRDDVRELVFREGLTLPPEKAFGPLARFKSQKHGQTWHGLSTKRLAQAVGATDDRQIREYLLSENLTTVSRTVWTNIVAPIIKLAVREALKTMPDDVKDESWKYAPNAFNNWQDVLINWRTCA